MRKNEAPPGRSGRDAASTLDIAEVLLRVVRDARRLLQGKVTSLMLERGGGFETVASDGAGRAYLSREPPAVRNSVSGRVLQSGQPITVQDVLSEPCFHRVDVAQAEGLVSLLSVPLRTKHRIIGVLNLLNLLVEQFGGRLHASTDRVVGGVVVRIRDTGLGVARGVLDRLFEPFVTTRVGGTGLGLRIFHRIIEGHRHLEDALVVFLGAHAGDAHERVERMLFDAALGLAHGSQVHAARLLGVTPNVVRNRMANHTIGGIGVRPRRSSAGKPRDEETTGA